MNFLVDAVTDTGIRKKNNQDSYCYKIIDSTLGKIFFAVLCDGMGGLQKGEVASATLVKHFSDWAENDLKRCLSHKNFSDNEIRTEFNRIIQNENRRIFMYGKKISAAVGTTVTVLLIINNKYFIANVGDTRAYEIRNDSIRLITHDHSLVQREVDNGIITKEQARVDSRKNILLQCIGATRKVSEDIFIDNVYKNSVFILATDGFRNKVTDFDILNAYNVTDLTDGNSINSKTNSIIKMVKDRLESDNISAVVVKCY